MKLRNFISITLTISILALPVAAFSAARVTIDTLVEKQEVLEVNGQKQTRFIATEKATPGDTLRFTLVFRNDGDAVAENVLLSNPIPPNSIYLDGSATAYEGTLPLFSVDGGTSFNTPSSLTYETKNPDGSASKKVASPEEYTHIRWQLPPLPAGAAGQVSFNVLIQ